MIDQSMLPGENSWKKQGYKPEEMDFLGHAHPNPAIQANLYHMYLAKNVKLVQKPVFDATENIALKIVPYDQIPHLIRQGKISHALVIVAFHYLSFVRYVHKPIKFA